MTRAPGKSHESTRNEFGVHSENREERFYNPAGRNRRTVWEIPTQPFPEAHFATFPEALVEPCIKAGTSERGCCPVCGAPWERQTEPTETYKKSLEALRAVKDRFPRKDNEIHSCHVENDNQIAQYRTVGWSPTCTHTAEPIPCTVLDPFAGSGTVAKVARDLNRSSIGIELNAGYVEIIKRRMRLFEQLGFGVTYEIIEV